MFFESSSKKLAKLEINMAAAESYQAWCSAAEKHDLASGASEWKELEHTSEYDYKQIRHRLEALQRLRRDNNYHGLLFALNEGIHGNMGGMGKPVLYNHAKYGTKKLIEEYVDEIVESIEHIAELDASQIDYEERLDFFHRASLCYGRTALMLSGGGALGHFHIGVVKALLQQNLLPSVISGASAGSVITAIFGTHTDLELKEL
ncbi:patatin-like phospholipase family protein, partial [Oleiphilus sp. HI0132]